MKMFLLIFNIIHAIVFVLSLFFIIFIYMFKDTAGPLPLPFKIFTWAFFSYPVIFIVSLLLSRFVNEKFIYLPVVNLLILASIMIFFVADTFLVTPIMSSNKTKSENTKVLQNASRDFVCGDGAFFSLQKQGDETSTRIISYFSSDFVKNPGKFDVYISLIGSINNKSNSSIDIAKYQNQVMGGDVKERLNICKNKDGKTLLEIYPEEK